jgi:hypothetical protein
MTTAFANVQSPQLTGGVPYATALLMPSSNADNDLNTFTTGPLKGPIPTAYAQTISAKIQLVIAGSPASNTTNIVLQTDMG